MPEAHLSTIFCKRTRFGINTYRHSPTHSYSQYQFSVIGVLPQLVLRYSVIKIQVTFFWRALLIKRSTMPKAHLSTIFCRSKHLLSFTHAHLLAVPVLSNWGSPAISTAVLGSKNFGDVFLACVADKKEHNAEGAFKYDFLRECTHLGVNTYRGDLPPPASNILKMLRPFEKNRLFCSIKSREQASRADT